MSDTMMPPEVASRRSPEIKNLAAALVKAQAAMEGARKDKNNPHFKSAYADLGAVWDAVRDPLTANGLAVVQFPRTTQNGVEIETTLLHTSGEFMSDVLWLPAQMTAQGIGSAMTYARRYALMAVAGVAAVDDDGNGAVGNGRAVPQKTAMDAVHPDDQHLVKGDGRSTYQVATAEKSSGRLMAELWASEAVGLFTQDGYDLLNYKEWKVTPCTNKGTKTNEQKLAELREKHPDLAEKIDEAVSNLKVAAA